MDKPLIVQYYTIRLPGVLSAPLPLLAQEDSVGAGGGAAGRAEPLRGSQPVVLCLRHALAGVPDRG
eukprot:5198912-Pyramimonas_sp.AAC.1